MIYMVPTDHRIGGHRMSRSRLKGARVAALLATCCLPSVPGLAQTQNCPPAPAHPLATNLATIKEGDYWIYEQSGTVTLPASAAAGSPASAPAGPPSSGAVPAGPVPISGTFVEHVETRTFQGQPTLALVVEQKLLINGASIYGNNPAPQQIFYVQQIPIRKTSWSLATMPDRMEPMRPRRRPPYSTPAHGRRAPPTTTASVFHRATRPASIFM